MKTSFEVFRLCFLFSSKQSTFYPYFNNVSVFGKLRYITKEPLVSVMNTFSAIILRVRVLDFKENLGQNYKKKHHFCMMRKTGIFIVTVFKPYKKDREQDRRPKNVGLWTRSSYFYQRQSIQIGFL